MGLTDEEIRFVAQRVKWVGAWPLIGGCLLCMLLALGGWLLWTNPLLVNPFAVLERLRNDAIPLSTLTLMAGLLPLCVVLSLVLAVAIVLFCFAAFAQEKKYVRILKRFMLSSEVSGRNEFEQGPPNRYGGPKNNASLC